MKNNDYEMLFIDRETGEDFIVEVLNMPNVVTAMKCAVSIAKQNFTAPRFICELTFDEADMLGLDTY